MTDDHHTLSAERGPIGHRIPASERARWIENVSGVEALHRDGKHYALDRWIDRHLKIVKARGHRAGKPEDRLRVARECQEQGGRVADFIRRQQQEVPAAPFGHAEVRGIQTASAGPSAARGRGLLLRRKECCHRKHRRDDE